MKYEKSCGAVVYRKIRDNHEFLIIKHSNGHHWGFPKGHVEKNELETETALREIEEETGLKVKLYDDFRYTMEYAPKAGTIKEVIYFIAEANEYNVSCQLGEIETFKWLKFNEAARLLTHNMSKELLTKVNEYLVLRLE